MPNEETKPRQQAVCRKCGSTDVGCDANAVWDVEAQDWVLGGIHDSEWCSVCGADGHNVIEMKEHIDAE